MGMKSECRFPMDRCFQLSMVLVIFLQTLYQVGWIKIKKEIKKIFYRSQRDIENTYQTELRLVRILPTKGLKLSQSIKPRKKSDIDKYNVIQVLPTFEYTYLRKENVRLYGSVAAGAMLYLHSNSTNNSKKEKSESVFFASQVNPIAIQVGKRIGGLAELGFGTRGIATAGLFCTF